MSRTDDIIDKTKRKEPEAKKWKVVAGIVMGLIVGGALFGLVFCFADVDEYLISSKDILSLYHFYDTHQPNGTEVYFVGSSIIGSGIYPPKINEYLEKSGYNITTYNLKISSDTPLQRALHIQEIINLHPEYVIYGVSYRSITSVQSAGDTVWNSENAILIGDRVNLGSDITYLLSEDEVSDLKSESDLMFNKRFLKSALYNKLFGKNTGYLDYEYDPYGGENARISLSSQTIKEIERDANNPEHNWRPIITNESTRHKDALIYNVKELQNAGISVILVNMPLHPLVSDEITDESRQNFYDLLDETGANWYDYEFLLEGEYFRDTHHMTYDGALAFAPVMADLIIQEMS